MMLARFCVLCSYVLCAKELYHRKSFSGADLEYEVALFEQLMLAMEQDLPTGQGLAIRPNLSEDRPASNGAGARGFAASAPFKQRRLSKDCKRKRSPELLCSVSTKPEEEHVPDVFGEDTLSHEFSLDVFGEDTVEAIHDGGFNDELRIP